MTGLLVIGFLALFGPALLLVLAALQAASEPEPHPLWLTQAPRRPSRDQSGYDGGGD